MLEVDSVAGEGTHVIVYLPAIDARSLRHSSTVEMPRPAARSGKVLLLDSDGVIRRMLGRMLRQSGFSVAEVDDATQAVAYVRLADVDVVVMDVKVAGRDPLALHEAMTRSRPGLRSVLVSRQAAPELESGAHSHVIAVRKPFTFDYLLTVVERMLEHAQDEADSAPLTS
jgi:DNA-binding NtrC family response regulator